MEVAAISVATFTDCRLDSGTDEEVRGAEPRPSTPRRNETLTRTALVSDLKEFSVFQ